MITPESKYGNVDVTSEAKLARKREVKGWKYRANSR